MFLQGTAVQRCIPRVCYLPVLLHKANERPKCFQPYLKCTLPTCAESSKGKASVGGSTVYCLRMFLRCEVPAWHK